MWEFIHNSNIPFQSIAPITIHPVEPWLLPEPQVIFDLAEFPKESTPPHVYKDKFQQITYKNDENLACFLVSCLVSENLKNGLYKRCDRSKVFFFRCSFDTLNKKRRLFTKKKEKFETKIIEKKRF